MFSSSQLPFAGKKSSKRASQEENILVRNEEEATMMLVEDPDDPDVMQSDENDPTPAVSQPSAASVESFQVDFRDNMLPSCVEVIGPNPTEFVFQKDGSTALKVPPGSFLKISTGLKSPRGKFLNDYTLTLDILFDRLPEDSASLFQSGADGKLTEGEAFVYSGGGVGVFGEVGVPEAAMKENKWTRIVVTLGGAQLSQPQKSQRAPRYAGFGSRGVEDESIDFGDSSSQFRSMSSERVFTTYVNSRKCAVISSNRRGIIGTVDGRMAINPQSLLLFGSNRDSAMPGCLVRFVELKVGASTEETVRLEAQKNRIYSSWEKDQQEELQRIRANLTLSNLFKKPPPIWAHPGILAEFGDAHLEGSGLEGGDLPSTIAVFSIILQRILLHNGHGIIDEFGHDCIQCINAAVESVKSATKLFRRYGVAAEQGGGAQLIHFMKKFRNSLVTLAEGQSMLIPGGIGQRVVLYIVEREAEDNYRFSIVNTDPNGGLMYHPSRANNSPRLQYQPIITVKNVTAEKMLDDAFWGMLFKLALYPSKHNTADKVYDLLIPYLVDKPLEQIIAESDADVGAVHDWRNPQRASISSYRSIMEAFHYLIRRRGLTLEQSRKFFYAFHFQIVQCIEHDLSFMRSVRDSDRRVILLSCQQLAYFAAKLGEDGLLTMTQLKTALTSSEKIRAQCLAIDCVDADLSASPNKLVLDSNESNSLDNVKHPFMDRLRREEDVNGLAGAPIVLPRYVPVDFFLLPNCATNLEQAIEAIRYCDRLCTLISVQGHCVKNRAHHKLALIEHTFTHVLPMPKAVTSELANQCIWRTPMRYGVQLDITICLGRIMEHFISSSFSMHETKSKDALNLIITGCIVAVIDVVLRKAATDQPSEFCLHLMGERDESINQPERLGRGMGYGISIEGFAAQTETVRLYTPELAIARTAVLDYFNDQTKLTKIFNWNEGHKFEPSFAQFMAGICSDLAFPQDDKSFIEYATSRSGLINKNYPEFHVYRDCVFFMKYVQNVDPRAFPPKSNFSQATVELNWGFQEGAFIIEAFMRGFSLRCYPMDPFKGALHRYPSSANPTVLASPHQINTEDDVLHKKNLPSFKDCIGQQDSELLLSYLTVPYLRIPLVLSLFATEDRIHSLRSDELQEVVDAVLFEPGTYLPCELSAIPQQVPSTNKSLLATPFGLLLNELYRSPQVIMDSMLSLVKLAVNLDVGTVHSSTVPIVLFVLRIVSRMDSAVTFLIRNIQDDRHHIISKLRDVTIPADIAAILTSKREEILTCIRQKVVNMLESWCIQLSLESFDKGDDEVVDANTRVACQLHAHLLLLHRNVAPEEYTLDVASIISSSFLFLTSRHTWNLNLLGIPENEIFEVLMVQRKNLITWSRHQPQQVLNELMEATVRVTVGTGIRKFGNTASSNQWAYIDGIRSVGRFTIASTRGSRSNDSVIRSINPNIEMGIEVDFQTAQLTLKSSHLQALDTAIASDPDVQMIFGKKSMQASIVESSENRLWVHLVGRDHDVHYWRTPDQRTAVVELDRDYSPGEVEESEQWIIPILEPVRMMYMTQPFVLQICMPEKPLPPDADVAMLVGIHPKLGGTWKEIFVFRSLQMVQVYQVLSHGRRFYRVLEYTSDVRYTLRDMQPSLDDRKQLWPAWERHGAGHPYQDHWGNPLSCVITRGSDHPKNLSGMLETLVPERLLYGIVPQALLQDYIFWQDDSDALVGYPRDENCPYLIEVILEDVRKVRCSSLPGVCGNIHRVLKTERKQLLKDRALLVSHLGATIKPSSSAVSNDNGNLTAAENSWSFGPQMLVRMDKIIQSAVPLEDIKDFVDALRASGVVYQDAEVLVKEVEMYVRENAVVKQSAHHSKITSELLEQSKLTLINIGFCDPNSKFHDIIKTLSRLENAGYILCWTLSEALSDSANINVDLIELPRLKMSFGEHADDNGIHRLYSLDHVNLFVSNFRSELTAKLMQGLPHSLLMSTANEELQVLVPAIDPVRPRIGTSPFTTELVMNRSMNPSWYGAVESTYFLYPIHVSLSFLFSPTLSSSLYLLLLRFLNRNYEEVFKLASTISTDIEYSPEEDIIFTCLGRSNSDCHPDAHACRLKIALVVFDSPVTCPFDITSQMSRYITKLNHVSAVCRLSLSEELILLESCVCDATDPRFIDPATGFPRYTLYEITIVKNRKYYLRALTQGQETAEVFVVPRQSGTNWPVDRNIAAIMLDESALLSLEVSYSAPNQSSANAALDIIDKFWPGQEDMAGHVANLGFLYLYELMTGTKQIKLLSTNNSISIARLLFELTSDKAESALLPSILNLMSRFPQLIPLMPKYSDRRSQKTVNISGVGNDVDLISPLGQLLAACLNVIGSEIADILEEVPDYSDHPTEQPNICTVNKLPWEQHLAQQAAGKSIDCPSALIFDSKARTGSWIIPSITNFSCESRQLNDIDASNPIIQSSTLGMNVDELQRFSGSPLSALDLNQFVSFVSREDINLPPISGMLPFDVESHDQAKSAIAQSMLQRLRTDMAEFANSFNSDKSPKLACLLSIEKINNNSGNAFNELQQFIANAKSVVSTVLTDLEALRSVDMKYVDAALPWLLETANYTPYSSANQQSTSAGDADEDPSRLLFLLKRFCKQEVTLWLEFLFGSILSSVQVFDLQLLNPYLDSSRIECINAVIVASIFHANRIGMINRCIADARDLLSNLTSLGALLSGDLSSAISTKGTKLIAAALLKGESLARNLCVGRHYVESIPNTGEEMKRRRTGNSYDPRFLLFEFTWNILLRKSQVEMVLDYKQALKSGAGMVKQMIMGAGKTTVVCPLLTLMLGDGENLIVQVVPPALLEFSRSVMRSTFSAIMQKRIFTLSFDRSSEIDPSMLKKLNMAKYTRGVVISTPTTIKSVMLKFLELLRILSDPSTPRAAAVEVDAAELGKSLTLFKESILIMDEVDLILHPMKSELNFPIGDKIELDFSPQRWQMPIHLLDGVFYADRKRISVNFKQSNRAKSILEKIRAVIESGYQQRALQRNPHIVLLNLDWYKAKLQPVMADWLFMWLEAQHLAGLPEAAIKKFLIEGANSAHNPELASAIQTNLSPNHRKMLNLGKDWLHSYLPHVLQKIDRVSFGIMNAEDYERAIKSDPRMPRTRAKLAIPFVGKDVPSRSSEFAHPDVIIGLTILAYRYEGLRWTDFEDIMNNLRSTLTKELGPWSKRKSNIRYARWIKEAGGSIYGEEVDLSTSDEPQLGLDENGVPNAILDENSMEVVAVDNVKPGVVSQIIGANSEKVVVSLRLLKRSNEEQMKKLFKLLQHLPDTIHYYLENFIFPVYTDSKIIKLSAAGQELGGEMLFQKRIGFSGTPSDLLPIELGSCGYERCSDGQMIHVLTSPNVCSYEVVQEGWSPISLLEAISCSENPRYHALIDTGALITGYTNLQVAQMLLKLGLKWCEGVVFLDEYDRKMVLVRATGRVLKMTQCGVPAEKRFAFYDQVHTTGMDISHVLDAKAVLTISKDMVFRDIAQGAYRMRGINKGQTVHVMIIPEVKDLIIRELGRGKSSAIDFSHWFAEAYLFSREAIQRVLCDISAWLVVNSMRSERVQFNQLCIQNVANVYRKGAFSNLLSGHTLLKISHDYERIAAAETGGLKKLLDSLQVFCEPIDFSLEDCVPDIVQFSESIRNRVAEHAAFVKPEDSEVIEKVLSWITAGTNKQQGSSVGSPTSSRILSPDIFIYDEQDRLLGAEMVQEQEQEQEQEKEQEQEQEIEIEKYVDLAYSREHEEPTPWPFSSLSSSLASSLPQFYSAAEFKLYKRKALYFPEYCLVSNNYFDCRWSGARRIKNVVMVLDWVPDTTVLETVFQAIEILSESQRQGLESTFDLLDIDNIGSYSVNQLQQFFRSALHLTLSEAETLVLIEECILWERVHGSGMEVSDQINASGNQRAPIMAIKNLLLSGRYSQIQRGRSFVCVSLAEAETIRCIMHRRIGSPVIPGSATTVALRCVPTGFTVIDESNVLPASAGTMVLPSRTSESSPLYCPYMTESTLECFKFLNCELFFSEKSINTLLRALHGTGKRDRRLFFKNIIGCRRRLAKKWNDYSVAKLFTLSDYFGLLKQRATSVCFREAIQSRGMLLYDAFNKFNASKNGLLSPGEVWGALTYLSVELSAMDILDFVNAADMDRDGNISYKELVDILSDPDKQGVNDEEDSFVSGSVGMSSSYSMLTSQPSMSRAVSETSMATIDEEIAPSRPIAMKRQISLSPVAPRGEEELALLKKELLAQEEAAERLEAESEGLEERRIRDELEAEEDEKDRTQLGGRNPKIGADFTHYDFSTGRMPRFVSTRGDCNYRQDNSQLNYLKVFPQALMMVSIPFKDGNCGGRRLNQYSITIEVMNEMKPPSSNNSNNFRRNYLVEGLDDSESNDESTFRDMPRMGRASTSSVAAPDTSNANNVTVSNPKGVALFSTAAFGEMEALMWVNPNGKLVASANGAASSKSQSSVVASVQSSNSLAAGKWSFVTLVVDCIEGVVEMYVNGRPSGKLQLNDSANAAIGHLDGPWSMGDQMTLFGTRTASECGNGAIRRLFVQNRCLLSTEVEDLVQELKREGESELLNDIVVQLMGMGFPADIARWAANQAEGTSREERLNAAISFLS